jgi:hypothetical protein
LNLKLRGYSAADADRLAAELPGAIGRAMDQPRRAPNGWIEGVASRIARNLRQGEHAGKETG